MTGSQYRAKQFQAEIKWLGIRSTPAYVGEPECDRSGARWLDPAGPHDPSRNRAFSVSAALEALGWSDVEPGLALEALVAAAVPGRSSPVRGAATGRRQKESFAANSSIAPLRSTTARWFGTPRHLGTAWRNGEDIFRLIHHYPTLFKSVVCYGDKLRSEQLAIAGLVVSQTM